MSKETMSRKKIFDLIKGPTDFMEINDNNFIFIDGQWHSTITEANFKTENELHIRKTNDAVRILYEMYQAELEAAMPNNYTEHNASGLGWPEMSGETKEILANLNDASNASTKHTEYNEDVGLDKVATKQ